MAADVPLRFGVVVLNFRQAETTRACIDSILSLKPPPHLVVLVDNASEPGSGLFFERRYGDDPRVNLLRFRDNRGYTGGNNAGIAHLIDQGVDIICLLNNDTLLLPGFFQSLSECFASSTPPDIVTPLILYEDGRTIWSAGERTCYPLLISRTCRGRIAGRGWRAPPGINNATGCALAVRSSVFRRLGLLDDAYFAYVEDSDLCKRSLDAGFRISVCPGAKIVHKVSQSAGHLSPAQIYLKTRNRAYFIRKNIHPGLWPLSYAWYFFLNLTWAARGVALKDPRSVRAVAAGMADGLKGRMGAGRFDRFPRSPPRPSP